ncbi:putative ER glycosyl hydrolase [Stachybotrys elegans]|uniref:alpha-1,2-Mannosidase n=1 Tax=Stachybotrys elegans TaxID=80388 RepID=A0A8K0SSV6_9HYPO|nr:putative ER glycosyl hydrolase [Stachybotrys elegans]
MSPRALFALLLTSTALPWVALAMRADKLAALRQETVEMFYHGFSNYMKHGFPEDELRPVSCAPLSRDRENPGHIGLNDALGNYSLTLIDSLSTLAILAGGPQDGSHTGPRALGDFQDGVAQLVLHYGDGRAGPSGMGTRAAGFDLDSKVQVFETVIRGVGGLLSAHLFAIGELPINGYNPKPVEEEATGEDPMELPPIYWPNGFKYDGQLLRLAFDLAERLLPAFYTLTGIPYPRVNLRHGIPFYVNSPLHDESEDAEWDENSEEVTETCSAGAGSLTLEFTVLSRLSGDDRFEQAAKRAFWGVWERRSEIGLIGNGINAEDGAWIGPHSGIGAGMDSFFEYALKSHILLSGHDTQNASRSTRPSRKTRLDPNTLHPPLSEEMQSSEAFLDAWHHAHAAVKRYLYTDRSHYPYYSNSHRATGQPYTMWIDSLGAFYPGLLALAGELEEAIEANLVYTALWTRYAALPERWSIRDNNVEAGIAWWPGRPEFVESTYHIYRATKDPWYLHVGEMVIQDVRRRCWAPCGWAGLQDVRTGEMQDRMESFFLGETTKYLYLLFDTEHPLNKLDAAYVFTTEGHPLLLPKEKRRPKQVLKNTETVKEFAVQREEVFKKTCPVPPVTSLLAGSATAARPDLFDVSRFTELYKTPNFHAGIKAIEVDDNKGGQDTRYVATSNHTIFPWTLPPTLLPENGTCAARAQRVISWIEFPTSDAATSILSRFSASILWYDHTGPTIRSLEGLKVQLERQAGESQPWRISHVGNTQLGKHEKVFFHAEHVSHLKDNAFTCIRRHDKVEIEMIAPAPEEKNASAHTPADSKDMAHELASSSVLNQVAVPSGSLLQSLLRAVSSVFDPTHTSTPESGDGKGQPQIYTWWANTATGPGACPLPPVANTPLPGYPKWDAKNPVGNFPWKTIFMADQACDGPLPDSAPLEHQVIVMRRGGCSFSRKLDNIPSFAQQRTSLQLVIIVDEIDDDNEEETPRPLLDTEQMTPNGVKRLHGVPMVLIHASKGEYELFGHASAVGLRRKYRVQSQGLWVENAVVL